MAERRSGVDRLVVVAIGGLARVGNRYATYLTYAEYLSELAALVGGLRVYAPVFESAHPEYDYFAQMPLDPALCTVVPLSGHGRDTGGATLIRNYLQQAHVFARDAVSWRRVLVYSPSATAALAAGALRWRASGRPAIYTYVGGDWAELSRHLPQRGVVRTFANLWQRQWICAQERWLVRHSRATWVAGPQLRQRYAMLSTSVAETIPMIKGPELHQRGHVAAARAADRLLYVGRIAPGKGLEVLLEAVGALAVDLPRLTLRLVGKGDVGFVDQLRAYAVAQGIADRVIFVGLLPNGPELWAEYERAAAFVLPSLSEGFPRVLYEAMALGTPIVASAVGSVPTLLEPTRHALLVPPGDVVALTAALRELLTSPDRGAPLAAQARQLFEQRIPHDGASTARQIAQAVLHGGTEA